MKFAIAEQAHEKYLEDVAREVSQDSLWQQKLIAGQDDEQFLLTYKDLTELPCALWTTFSKYGLEFLASRVDSCPEKFDSGLTILKFEAKEFSRIVKYSGI